jgi:hypothetical protein
MRIVGSQRAIVFRGAHTSSSRSAPSITMGNARVRSEPVSPFVPARCSEGDTLLPGRDLIGELRRAVAAAEASRAG